MYPLIMEIGPQRGGNTTQQQCVDLILPCPHGYSTVKLLQSYGRMNKMLWKRLSYSKQRFADDDINPTKTKWQPNDKKVMNCKS